MSHIVAVSYTSSRPMIQPVGKQSDTKLAVMLVMMWNRLGIPCLNDAVSTALKIAMKPPKPGAFPAEIELN